MIKTIPLSKLVPSPRNVRRLADGNADAELKADIEAHGLLQNLVVTGVRKPKGCFAVEAGERRRRALQALADEGKLPPEHEVCCLVVDLDSAQEASLAENFQRLAMNPADECLAFQQLAGQGLDAEAIARRFGLTVRFVEGRLRLADLAPVVFDALGAGEISLDVAKAYAATSDRERQAYVFEQVSRSYMGSHPDSIRRMVTQASVSAGDRRARLVGEEVYLAAGGRIERDLFSEEDDARWLDAELLERLACEKMDALASAAAAEHGLAFVRPTLDSWVSYSATEGLRQVHLERAPLSDEDSSRLDELETESDALAVLLEDEQTGESEREAAEARLRELSREIESIVDRAPVVPEEMRPRLGTFLLLDRNGCPKLDTAFYMEEGEAGAAGPSAADECSAEDAEPAAPARRSSLPRRLVDELAMQRRDILAAHVAADPAFALDLAVFLMADPVSGYCFEKSGSTLSARRPSDPIAGFETPETRAALADAEAASALDRSWSEGATRGERFDAFRALPDAARAAWLGHCIARTLEASAGTPGERACAFHDHLGMLLGIDVAAWWRPTGANYFDRVPKSVALEALTEVGGAALSGPYSKSKKAQLADACERIFAGNFIADADVKQAALAWVPEAMRFARQAADALAEAELAADAGARGATLAAGPDPLAVGEAA
ncbi:MAG: ParB N-terminal domain-containing protein [Bacillota bacterium]